MAPITAGQVDDLLSPSVEKYDGNLFSTVEPEECSGVAKEVDPPFIFDLDPAATDGGHWMVDDPAARCTSRRWSASIARTTTRRTHCRRRSAHCNPAQDLPFTVTDMKGRSYDFTLLPPVTSASPNILLWSFSANDWACDSTFVAAHNAAIEISTCGPVGGYPVGTLANDALNRIEDLANTTA